MFIDALNLLITGNELVWINLANALEVAGYAVVLAFIVGIPFGLLIGLHRFPGKRLLTYLLHIWLIIPVLSMGIFIVYINHQKMVSPIQFIFLGSLLCLPLIVALVVDIIGHQEHRARLQAEILGANRWQQYGVVLREVKIPFYGIVITVIGRLLTEIGGFFLVVSFIYHQGFPSRPIFTLPDAVSHLAVALGLMLFGGLIYTLIYVFQFRGEDV